MSSDLLYIHIISLYLFVFPREMNHWFSFIRITVLLFCVSNQWGRTFNTSIVPYDWRKLIKITTFFGSIRMRKPEEISSESLFLFEYDLQSSPYSDITNRNTSIEPCSDCFLQYEAAMLGSAYGRQRVDRASFSSLLSSCSVLASSYPYSTLTSTSSLTSLSATSSPTITCTGTTYTVK
jgi:hypothetical protein